LNFDFKFQKTIEKMCAAKSTNKGNAITKSVSVIIISMIDAYVEGIIGSKCPAGADTDKYNSIFAGGLARKTNNKKFDICGPKGNAFSANLLTYAAECYKNGGENHASLVAVRDYCSQIKNFEQFYLSYKTTEDLRAVNKFISEIANEFATEPSEKDKAKSVVENLCGFLIHMFINNCFVSAAPLKPQGFHLLFKKLTDEGLFTNCPAFSTDFANLINKTLEAAPKKAAGKKTDKSTSQPTDGDNQISSSKSQQLNSMLNSLTEEAEAESELDLQ
jgi:hypothetical protein